MKSPAAATAVYVTKDGDPMGANVAPRCEYRPCSRVLERAATGRPPRYCGPNCRQAAHRERVRQAEEAAAAAAELAEARATSARLWPQLEEASLDVAETATAVLSYAAYEDPEDRGALEYKLGELRTGVAELERLALGYRRAEERAASGENRSNTGGQTG